MQIFFIIVFLFLMLLYYRKIISVKHSVLLGKQIFNPLSYNLGIYILTGFIGSFAILIAPEGLSINTMVDSYGHQDVRFFAFFLMLYGLVVFSIFSIAFAICAECLSKD